MTDIRFGRLQDLPLRDAWAREDRDFTPWLAENIDHLSEAIGIPLELTGTEVAVETFSADILARNPMDGTVVLIENQLETTNHMHLGQIMTYLAGLDAHTVVWIAPSFREPHLSAIRWLNKHTADGFSFFAIRARVVRIGESPFAPIFDVVVKPDGWSRALTETRREASVAADPGSEMRLAFWTYYVARHPAAIAGGIKPQRAWNAYSGLAGGDIQISVWVGTQPGGIYLRGGWGDRKDEAARLLGPHLHALAARLGCDVYESRTDSHVLGQRAPASLGNYSRRENWDALIDWLEERRTAYIAAVTEALEAPE